MPHIWVKLVEYFEAVRTWTRHWILCRNMKKHGNEGYVGKQISQHIIHRSIWRLQTTDWGWMIGHIVIRHCLTNRNDHNSHDTHSYKRSHISQMIVHSMTTREVIYHSLHKLAKTWICQSLCKNQVIQYIELFPVAFWSKPFRPRCHYMWIGIWDHMNKHLQIFRMPIFHAATMHTIIDVTIDIRHPQEHWDGQVWWINWSCFAACILQPAEH